MKQTLVIVGIFVLGLLVGLSFSLSGLRNGPISLSPVDFIFLILAIISSVLGIVAIIFSWMFYQSGQHLNEDTTKLLSDITQKVSKIDDVINKQFDKVLSKAIGIEYEGEVPISDIQILNRQGPRRRKQKK